MSKGSGAIFGGGAARRATITSSSSLSPSFRVRSVSQPYAFSPSAKAGARADEVPVREEDQRLIDALREEVACLEDELAVKNEMARCLGTSLVAATSDMDGLRRATVVAEQQLKQLQWALATAQQQSADHAPRVQSLEARVRELEDALAASDLTVTKPLIEEIRQLKAQRDDLETQMTDWKAKVKEALKEGKRREQQLTSSEITLKTELNQLQEKLNEAAFQLQVSAAMTGRQRAMKETQTDEVAGATAYDGYHSPHHLASPHGDGTANNILRRRRSILETRERGASIASSLALTIPNAALTASMEFAASPPAASPVAAVPPLPLRGSSIDHAQSVTYGFPLPLSPLNPQQMMGSAASPGPASPMRIDDPSAPEPAPFVVTVHYCTSEGWSIDSKHRVQRGLTVAALTHQCCEQFNSRYQQSIDASAVCLRMNHDRAKRSVVLSPLRELHSFSFFQRCQREGVPILLYLSARDEMQEYVQLRLRARKAEEAIEQSQ